MTNLMITAVQNFVCYYFPNTVLVSRPVCLHTLHVLICPLQHERHVYLFKNEMVYIIWDAQGGEIFLWFLGYDIV